MLSFMKQGRPSTKPRTDFGQRMADARERAGLTQQQLAERRGTSQRAVAHWERDPVALRPDQIAAVADLVAGQAAERRPLVLVRGLTFAPSEQGATALLRRAEEDLYA